MVGLKNAYIRNIHLVVTGLFFSTRFKVFDGVKSPFLIDLLEVILVILSKILQLLLFPTCALMGLRLLGGRY